MTDELLRQLLDERALEDLSGAELAAIRARLRESPAVREAVADRLQLEQALHQTVGHVRLPIELLLAKAAAVQATSTVAKLFGWGSVTGFMIGLVSVGLVASRGAPQAPVQPRGVYVAVEPASPSDLQPGDSADRLLQSVASEPAAFHRDEPMSPAMPRLQRSSAEEDVFFADSVQAARWRESLESVAGEVIERTIDDRSELVLRGTQLLRYHWPAEGRMRLRLADHDRFKIHLSHTGDTSSAERQPDAAWPRASSSLTLEYFSHPRPIWVAWLAARRGNQTLPETIALAAHDGGRHSQLTAGVVEVGFERGRVVVTHGDTELLRAPLAGLPDRVAFEGDAVVRGLDFAAGLPAVAQFEEDPAVPTTAAAEHDWHTELCNGATWNLLPAGRVELLAEDSVHDARAAVTLAAEVGQAVLELEDPLPGTGIYLCDRGDAVYRLAFVPGDKANQVCFALTADDHALARLPDGPTPLCPARAWFKFVSASGVLRAWFSCDGAYWSPVMAPELPLQAPLVGVGVYCQAGPGTRSVRIAGMSLAGDVQQKEQAFNLFGQLKRATPFATRFLVRN